MKKTSNRLHSLFAALAALILAAALAVPAFAVEGGFADLYYRMFDDAEVLTEDEDNELEDALEELSLRRFIRIFYVDGFYVFRILFERGIFLQNGRISNHQKFCNPFFQSTGDGIFSVRIVRTDHGNSFSMV